MRWSWGENQGLGWRDRERGESRGLGWWDKERGEYGARYPARQSSRFPKQIKNIIKKIDSRQPTRESAQESFGPQDSHPHPHAVATVARAGAGAEAGVGTRAWSGLVQGTGAGAKEGVGVWARVWARVRAGAQAETGVWAGGARLAALRLEARSFSRGLADGEIRHKWRGARDRTCFEGSGRPTRYSNEYSSSMLRKTSPALLRELNIGEQGCVPHGRRPAALGWRGYGPSGRKRRVSAISGNEQPR